ncbi:MAG: tetratricopeptide repeat protein [Candidatus Hermodarchaeota archaeon]
MSHTELKQLTKVEQLIDAGKLDEAFELISHLELLEDLNLQQESDYQYFKFIIFFYQNKHEELIKLGESIFEKGQKFNLILHKFDGLYYIIMGLALAYKFDEALKKIEKTEYLLNLISKVSKNNLKKREIRISALKGYIYLNLAKIDLAEKCVKKTLSFEKDLNIKFEKVWVHLILAQINLRVKIRYDLAMEYTKKAMFLTKDIKFKQYWIAMCHLFFGAIYGQIGEFERALEYNEKSLAIFKELKNNFFIAMVLNNSAVAYENLGKFDLAIESMEESLIIWEEDPINIETPIAGLVKIALRKGDEKFAQKYFQRLENMYTKKESSNIERVYYYVKALTLKRSSRIRDRAEVEKLFKHIIKTERLHHRLIIDSYINLCDLLLTEFRINNNSEVLDEINSYIAQLLTIAEKSHSYLVFCETFILQAKLALLKFDIKVARRFLTQAQKIAETYGIRRLAMKISYEHDKLLKDLHKWEVLNESKASLSDRIELAQLDDQMAIMLKKRPIEVPEASNEVPFMLLILTEGGNLLFSKKFIEDFSFEDDILGSVLTTINYIINEVFSEGLERAVFGQYTLLMMPLQPFLICYIFKGDSFYAHQRINNFLESIQNDSLIWQSLQNFFQMSKSVELHSIPKLDSLITEIFVEKKKID